MLERKKDYKARADDFHRKEKALEALQRKAEERNPDEFYFGMEHARTRGGVHVKRFVLTILSTCWHHPPARALSHPMRLLYFQSDTKCDCFALVQLAELHPPSHQGNGF